LAAFQVSTDGRFWVSAEEIRAVIITASETALMAAESQGFEIVHEVPEGLDIPV